MGIQINGNTDNISATDGGLTVSDLEINQSGISTFNGSVIINDKIRINPDDASTTWQRENKHLHQIRDDVYVEGTVNLGDKAGFDATPLGITTFAYTGIGTTGELTVGIATTTHTPTAHAIAVGKNILIKDSASGFQEAYNTLTGSTGLTIKVARASDPSSQLSIANTKVVVYTPADPRGCLNVAKDYAKFEENTFNPILRGFVGASTTHPVGINTEVFKIQLKRDSSAQDSVATLLHSTREMGSKQRLALTIDDGDSYPDGKSLVLTQTGVKITNLDDFTNAKTLLEVQGALTLTPESNVAEAIRIAPAVDASSQQEFGIGLAVNSNHTHPAAKITFKEFDASDSRGDLLFYTRGVNSDSAPTERLRIASSGQIGLSGTNYGTSGQVLTSGGSGSAVSWTTLTGTTINNNADNRVITGSGTANTLEGEANFTFDGGVCNLTGTGDGVLNLNTTNSAGAFIRFRQGGTNKVFVGCGQGLGAGSATDLGLVSDSGNIICRTNSNERLRIASGGQVIIGDDDIDKANGHFDDLIVGANASTTETHGITIVCGNAATNGGIAFSDGSSGGADAYRGMISYQHNDNHMQFRTNAVERLRITSDGTTLINATSVNAGGATPKMAIDVGDSNLHGLTIHAGGGESTGDLAGIAFSHGNTGDIARPKAAIAFDRTGSYGIGDLCFYVDGAGDNNAVAAADERMRIKSDGTVYMNSGFGSVAPFYGVRAWVQGSASGSANGSGGLSSVSRPSTGRFLLTFATTMPDTNYAIGCLGNNNYSDTSWHNNEGTDNVSVYFWSNGSYVNPSKWSAWVMR